MMPFAGGIESTANGALLLSLIASLFYLAMVERPPEWRRTAAKTLSIALLAILALVQGGPVLLVAALAVSALGDALLSRGDDKAFLAGLGAFLVGHLLYIPLFASSGEGVALLLRPERVVIGIAMVLAVAFLLPRLHAAIPAGMRLPVIAYVAAILALGLCALSVPGPWLVLGALSFMASDALLAIERFLRIDTAGLRTILRRAVWILYYVAQTIITLGILLPTSAIR